MTKDDVPPAAKRLVEFHESFGSRFGKVEAQDNAFTYIKGLMICPERKSIEPIVLNVGNGNVSAMQKFISSIPGTTRRFKTTFSITSTRNWSLRQRAVQSASSVSSTRAASPRRATTRRRRRTVQRSPGQERQLPSRCFPHGGNSRRNGPACSSIVSAGAMVRRHRREHGPTRQGSCARRSHVPNQAGDRRQSGPSSCGQRRSPTGLDHGRRTLRPTVTSSTSWRNWITSMWSRSPSTFAAWTTDPALCVPESFGHGQVPTRPCQFVVVSEGHRGRLACLDVANNQVAQGAKGPWPSISRPFASGNIGTTSPVLRAGSWSVVRSIQRPWDRSPEWSQFRSTGRQRGRWFSGYDVIGAYAGVARHVAKSAESNRTRNLAWQSLERTGRPGVRAC